MGRFNNKIEAEFNPPKQWVLSRALSYTNPEIDADALKAVGVAISNHVARTGNAPAHRITCKKGFKTDLASTPKALWNIIAPWDIARAAIIHDLLYLKIRQYRAKHPEDMKGISLAKKASDKVFLLAMQDSSPAVPTWKINAAYYAVVTFGRWSIIPREGDDVQL
jgi:hypothetical protein